MNSLSAHSPSTSSVFSRSPPARSAFSARSHTPRCKVCKIGLEKAKEGLLLCSMCCVDNFSAFKEKIGANEDLQTALEPHLNDKAVVVAKAFKDIITKEADAVSFRQICAGNINQWGLNYDTLMDTHVAKAIESIAIGLLPPILKLALTHQSNKVFAQRIANTFLTDEIQQDAAASYKCRILGKDVISLPADAKSKDVFILADGTIHPTLGRTFGIQASDSTDYIYYIFARLQYELEHYSLNQKSIVLRNVRITARKKIKAFINSLSNAFFPDFVPITTPRKNKKNNTETNDKEDKEMDSKSKSNSLTNGLEEISESGNSSVSEDSEEEEDYIYVDEPIRSPEQTEIPLERSVDLGNSGSQLGQQLSSEFIPSPKKKQKRDWTSFMQSLSPPPKIKHPLDAKVTRKECNDFFGDNGSDNLILKRRDVDANSGPFELVAPEIFTHLSFHQEDPIILFNNPERGFPVHITCIIGLGDPYSKLCAMIGGRAVSSQNLRTISFLQPTNFNSTTR